MAVVVKTDLGAVMTVKNSGEGVFDHFSEDELLAIGYALVERRKSVLARDYVDAGYADFLDLVRMKISSLVDFDFEQ